MNYIKIDLERHLGQIHPHIFGGFAEHLGRCLYGGIYQPGSPLADERGFRRDVLAALHRLQMTIMRYPGGNFVSGYHWRDGVGPVADRPARLELAWRTVEPNHFGTNEFIQFCRQLNVDPFIVVNCGDGDMREARDWVEYCNGTQNTTLANLRRQHGFAEPHQVKYWGIGNEIDGSWQIGYKTPEEYARAYLEFAKVMKWVDPSIKLIASAVSSWRAEYVERIQLLIEQAPDLIDYLALHWYVGNPENDFAQYMAVSELLEQRLSAIEGLIQAVRLQRGITRPIAIAVDEWNVWYRMQGTTREELHDLEEKYNLEDALVVAMHFNAFIRHARSVKMANIAQIVNVLAPIFTSPDDLFLQSIFHPFELYSRNCGRIALDAYWSGDTFSSGDYTALRTLDVAATLDDRARKLSVFVVNRSATQAQETTLKLDGGQFTGTGCAWIVNGPDLKAENSFTDPNRVGTTEAIVTTRSTSANFTFEPHSVTALSFDL
ncbi:MAG: alpha-N-arabinofuranosidase [Chloroflexi bacterium]|uniref:alpha-N-arabinofuranosidase n=1 Tax=Candidatus Flexifilum breve TaxID=3140694 RepID=UPI003136F612|nr:alpha-N-arabinofuranosidase [Chloroflexota bacterium]